LKQTSQPPDDDAAYSEDIEDRITVAKGDRLRPHGWWVEDPKLNYPVAAPAGENCLHVLVVYES
jgi:hypothetical protein